MKNLKKQIKAKGLRVQEFAQKVGVHEKTMSRIINGKQPHISDELKKKIQTALVVVLVLLTCLADNL